MRQPPSLFIFTLAVLAFSAVAIASPNFIVILTDDQSYVGSSALMDPQNPETKSDYFQTPQIERLMTMGMRFTQGYAPAPFCCPTRRSIQVGQTPARHLYQKDRKTWTQQYSQQLNIPRMLKQANPDYQTAHFGKWDHRFDEITPQDQGYDFTDGYTSNQTGGGKGSGGPADSADPKLIHHITKKSIAFMGKQASNQTPFFLQVSHYAVHLDIFYHQQTLKETKTWKNGRRHRMPEFAAMTYDVDKTIGEILDAVRDLKLEDNTYIFFLSDNGGRNDLPKVRKGALPRNYPLRNGKGSMYEGGIRVPFAVVGPGISENSLSRVPVTGLDIFPTMARLANYSNSLPTNIDGGNLVPVLHNNGSGNIERQNPFLIFHHAVDRTAQSAIRLGNFKLVKTWKQKKLQLFDLSNDLSEKRNISAANPDITQKLHILMTDFLSNVGAETRQTEK